MNIIARFAATPIDALMQLPPRNGQIIFAPYLFDMDERTLPRAKQVVLQG